ncbi:GNAT family protein [Streptosporangium canum]|uniref:GNAT family N-acetyltransferase n=1 Tax=Streptosporangium canum TaxID=324952 RepID=UPI0034439B4F
MIAKIASPYPPLNVQVHTPRLSLLGATDDLLEQLLPTVRKGVATVPPWPFDDPMSLYKDNPDREWAWLRGIRAGRAKVSDSFWRLYFVVVVDGEPVGMQDLVGIDFATFGTVTTFSWLGVEARGRGLGKEMRQAVLHLAFDGLGAREADSVAYVDNHASNRVSEALGYMPNGVGWSTRRGEAAEEKRWRLTCEQWRSRQRDDIELVGVTDCLPVIQHRRQLDLTPRAELAPLAQRPLADQGFDTAGLPLAPPGVHRLRLTRIRRAISGGSISAPNNSAACNRTASRRARPTAVSPPPCAYLTPSVQRRPDPSSAGRTLAELQSAQVSNCVQGGPARSCTALTCSDRA